jgi:hypothetical protein
LDVTAVGGVLLGDTAIAACRALHQVAVSGRSRHAAWSTDEVA